MRADHLAALNGERAARRAAALVTFIADGRQRVVREDDIEADPLADVLRKHFASGKSGLVATEEGEAFLTVQVPPVRLVIVGAVHISQAMASLAASLDFALTVIDPRTAFATPERFPGIDLVPEWPDTALGGRVPSLDRYCAVAALTHDPKIDDPALAAALRADCLYIGALGSRKTHAARITRLRQAGFSEGAIARIHAPIGLPIGAVSPAEIGLAILAEIIATLRRAPRPEVA